MSKSGMFRMVTIVLPILLAAVLLASGCSKPAPSPTPTAKPAQPPASSPAVKPSPAASPAAKPAASPSPAAKPSPAASPAPAAAGELPRYFTFASSGAGVSYTLSAFLSEMLTKYTPMKGAVERMTGTEQSVEAVAQGKAQACTYSSPAPRLICLQRKVLVNVMFSAAGTESAANIGVFCKPRADIKTVKDLKGKRVYAEKPSLMWGEPIMMSLLKANSMTKDDIKWLQFVAAEGDAFRDVKEGRVDAILYLAGAATMEMSESTGLYIIPFTPQEQQAIVDLNLGFAARVLPKGLYGATVDTPIVGAPNIMMCTPALSETTVYTMLKAVYEHLPEFHASQDAAKGFTLQNALEQKVFPYHPGAIKYFKEMKVWTAEHDKIQQKAVDDWKKIIGK